MPLLFGPFDLRSVKLKNRIVVSPMCEYSAVDGVPNDWHLVHLGSRAVGGCSLVLTEATAVESDGRISPSDTGIYNDEQQAAWARIVKFIEEQGSVPGIQLAHAGRKAARPAPWPVQGHFQGSDGIWSPIWSSSDQPFDEGWLAPVALDNEGLDRVRMAFRDATRRSLAAGFKVVEIHGAHGYLLHQFLSPLVNRRHDAYGGSLENRMRFPIEVVQIVREEWPAELPVIVRISASDWVEGGWEIGQSIEFSKECKRLGVDLMDCSSGGAVPYAEIKVGPGYQVHFADAIRKEAGIATGAVGMITGPVQAEEILQEGRADLIIIARELLRDPYWPRRAAKELGAKIQPPNQYGRAW